MRPRRSESRLLSASALLCALALVAAACGSSDSDSSSSDTTDDSTETTAVAEENDATGDTVEEDNDDGEAMDDEAMDDEAVEGDGETADDDAMDDEPVDDVAVAAGFPGVTETVQAFVDERGLSGASLIVVHRDEGVIYEEYFGEFEPGRISLIASSSKMMSAGVLLKLAEDGLLDLDAPVAGQIDWAVGNPDITPAQLVSNSSGLVGLGPDLLYAPYICQWIADGTIQECGETVFASPADDGDQAPPDTEFRYGGAQWQVAGAVAVSASGKSWDELIDEIYIQPCGVDSLGYLNLGQLDNTTGGYPGGFDGNPDGIPATENPNIEGGGYVSMADYATLMLMHLSGGACGDTQVLSQASLDTMHADRISATYDGNAGGPGFGYGMGWWVDRETGRISDGGAFGTVPWMDLDDGYGAYIVIEDQSATGQALKDEIEDLVHDAVVNR